jgi:hypothetical protein
MLQQFFKQPGKTRLRIELKHIVGNFASYILRFLSERIAPKVLLPGRGVKIGEMNTLRQK